MVKSLAEKKRLISPEPKIIRKLKARKTILPRPFRQIYLDFAEDVARELRTREFWVSTTAGTIGSITMSIILTLLGIEAILRKLGGK